MHKASGPREVFESTRKLELSAVNTLPPDEGLLALGDIAYDVGAFPLAAHAYNFAFRVQPTEALQVRAMGSFFVAAEAAGAAGTFEVVMPANAEVRAAMETFRAEAAKRAP